MDKCLDLFEQIRQTALDGFLKSIDSAATALKEAEKFKNVLQSVGYNIDNEAENNIAKLFWGTIIPAPKQDQPQKVTQFESVILNALATEGKQMFAVDIKDAFNKMTGKNYTRRNIASALAKMEDKGLLRYEKIMKGKVTKFLWYLPKWATEDGLIKKEYLRNDM